MRFYATLPMGFEEIAAREIMKFGGRIIEVRKGRGRIFFEGSEDLVFKLNYLSRTLERIMILLSASKISCLDDIYRIIRGIDFTWINPSKSFAIRPLRIGVHDFTSIDIGRVAGQAVIDGYQSSKGVRLKVNLDNPDIIIRVDVIHDEVYIGIDTTGDEALHRRGYRLYNHPAPLNPVIASSLIMLSGWNIRKTLLDPMCGSATIPIEAAMMSRGIPPQKLRRYFQFMKLDEILNVDEFIEFKEAIDINIDQKVYTDIICLEKFIKHLRGAILNSGCINVSDTINFILGDATKLDNVFKSKVIDVIITNPPYGLRIGAKKIIYNLYNDFLKSAKDIVCREIITITSEDRIMREAAVKHDYSITKEFKARYGDLDVSVFILKPP